MTTHGEAPNKKRNISDSNVLGITGFWLAFAGAPSALIMIFLVAVEGWKSLLLLLVILVARYLAVPLSLAGFVLGALSMHKEKRQNYGRVALMLSFLTLVSVAVMTSIAYSYFS